LAELCSGFPPATEFEMRKIHDRFFKNVFGEKGNLVDFIDGFLPRKLVESLDLSGARIVSPVHGSAGEEGRKEGRKEGRISEKQGVLKKLLSRKFGIDAKDEERILRQRDPDKLDDALEAVLFAASREEVLDRLK